MITIRHRSISSCAFATLVAFHFVEAKAQGPGSIDAGNEFEEANVFMLPNEVEEDHFAALKEHSPFQRTLDLSQSLIITGVARIGGETIATLLDLETSQTSVVSRNSVSPEGWQLVEVVGDLSDVETLAAKIKMG